MYCNLVVCVLLRESNHIYVDLIYLFYTHSFCCVICIRTQLPRCLMYLVNIMSKSVLFSLFPGKASYRQIM